MITEETNFSGNATQYTCEKKSKIIKWYLYPIITITSKLIKIIIIILLN